MSQPIILLGSTPYREIKESYRTINKEQRREQFKIFTQNIHIPKNEKITGTIRSFVLLTGHVNPESKEEEGIRNFIQKVGQVNKAKAKLKDVLACFQNIERLPKIKLLRILRETLVEQKIHKNPNDEIINFLNEKIKIVQARKSIPTQPSRIRSIVNGVCRVAKYALGAAFIYVAAQALLQTRNTQISPQQEPPTFGGRVGFFNGDFFVNQFGGEPIYCPPHLRFACKEFIQNADHAAISTDTLPDFSAMYVDKKLVHFPRGGEQAFVDYAEEIYAQDQPELYAGYHGQIHHACNDQPSTLTCYNSAILSTNSIWHNIFQKVRDFIKEHGYFPDYKYSSSFESAFTSVELQNQEV